MKILIIGNGWLGKRCKEVWGDEAVILGARELETKQDVLKLLHEHRPDAVLNAAGRKGSPNVDWCETHPLETIIGNVRLPLLIAEACQERGVYLLHIGSGCIFYGDSPHPDKAWREGDFGNPRPVYSRTKWAADLVLSTLPNVGIARIRLPIDSIPHAGNLIDKLAQYEKIIDVANSVTIIPDMIPALYQLMQKKAAGIFHVTNPGIVRHRDIIQLYTELVDPAHTNEWITEGELVAQGLASQGRSNNVLFSDNLQKAGIVMPPAQESLRAVMREYGKHRKVVILPL